MKTLKWIIPAALMVMMGTVASAKPVVHMSPSEIARAAKRQIEKQTQKKEGHLLPAKMPGSKEVAFKYHKNRHRTVNNR